MKKALIALILIFLISCHSYKEKTNFSDIKSINGTDIYVSAFGKGKPLIIVHGGPGLSHDYFLPHFKELAKDNFLIFYDHRGSGRSSVIQNKDSMNLKTFANDIEEIRKSFGLTKVNLLSHSWGALVSMEYVLNYSNNVEKLILSNPVALSKDYDELLRGKQLSKMNEEYKTNRETLMNSDEFKAKNLKAYEALFRLNFSLSFKNKLKVDKIELGLNENFFKTNALLQSFKGLENYNYYDRLVEIKIPTLLINGDYDLTILEADKRIVDSIKASKLATMKNSGHFPFIEEPKLYFNEIRNFLK